MQLSILVPSVLGAMTGRGLLAFKNSKGSVSEPATRSTETMS